MCMHRFVVTWNMLCTLVVSTLMNEKLYYCLTILCPLLMSVADCYYYQLSTRYVIIRLLLLLRRCCSCDVTRSEKNSGVILIVLKITKPRLIRPSTCCSIRPLLCAADPPVECINASWATHDTLIVCLCWMACTRQLSPVIFAFVPLLNADIGDLSTWY